MNDRLRPQGPPAASEAAPGPLHWKQLVGGMLADGLITLAGSRIYTSLADTDAVIDDALNRFEDVFKLV